MEYLQSSHIFNLYFDDKKVKKEIIRDTLNIIDPNGSIIFENSLNGIKSVVGVASTTFDISIPTAPKKLQYSNDDGVVGI